MKAIDVLKEEHRIIEEVLNALKVASDRLEQGKDISPTLWLKAVDFARNFADKCHHAKEEGVLFPELEAKGVPRQGGPIGVMLLEHEQGRSYIKALFEAANRLDQGDADAKKVIIQNSRNYFQLLSAHIQKEDNVLFVIAQNVLSSKDGERLAARFDQIEREEIGEGVHRKYHQLAEEIGKDVLRQ